MYLEQGSVTLKGRGKRRGTRGSCRTRESERPAPFVSIVAPGSRMKVATLCTRRTVRADVSNGGGEPYPISTATCERASVSAKL
jgi:hypothetical protein